MYCNKDKTNSATSTEFMSKTIHRSDKSSLLCLQDVFNASIISLCKIPGDSQFGISPFVIEIIESGNVRGNYLIVEDLKLYVFNVIFCSRKFYLEQ